MVSAAARELRFLLLSIAWRARNTWLSLFDVGMLVLLKEDGCKKVDVFLQLRVSSTCLSHPLIIQVILY
jgi:hypothetical protein